MFSKIVVGVDGSEPAVHAVKQAAALAKLCDAELHLINVPAYRDDGARDVGYRWLCAVDATATGRGPDGGRPAGRGGRRRGRRACPPRSMSGRATPQRRVVELAEEIEADLIVTGRRGLGGLASLVLGSTTQRIIHNAQCACLSVV